MQRIRLAASILFLVLGTLSARARADLIYDGDTLTDTVAGLSFIRGQLPTATFIPNGSSTVATYEQIISLTTSLGIAPSPNVPLIPAPHSPEIAAFADWFGAPAYLYAGPEPGEVCHGPNGGGNCFLGVGLHFQPDTYPLWTAYMVNTISRYGPTFSNPFSGWEAEFVPTVFVAPVPLPAGMWLALSGFAILARRKKLRG